MNLLQTLRAEEAERALGGKTHPDFSPGDTLIVAVKIKEESGRERIQNFEGVCIARDGGGLTETFTVRKISFGEGVERVFPVVSPNIDKITVKRKGRVRRAKLYYLRELRGKRARIAERSTGRGMDVTETSIGKTERKRKNAAAKADRKRAAAEAREAAAKAKAEEEAAAAAAEAAAAEGEGEGEAKD